MAATIDVARRQAGADTASIPATFTRSDFEAEILRLESVNFNLKIRVSQLEEALDDEPRLHAAPPAVALGKDGEEEVEGAGRGYGGISNGNGMRGVCSMNFYTQISVHNPCPVPLSVLSRSHGLTSKNGVYLPSTAGGCWAVGAYETNQYAQENGQSLSESPQGAI